MQISLSINPEQEVKKITTFLKKIQKKTGINKVVIGLSGGIDSTTVYCLLKKAYKPENIIGVNLPISLIRPIINQLNNLGGSIPKFFDAENEARHRVFSSTSPPKGGSPKSLTKKQVSSLLPMNQKISLGNIMARVRMIILFDLAKKHNALVCGTENKSERLLGYFTRFGDAASDIEPVTHLYKTQIYQLAKYLKVTKKIIDQPPTADLWKGQTDEGEFGFTYEEADQVLYLYFDKKIATKEIKRLGFKNVEKIIKRFLGNQFKQETPYSLFTLRYLATGRQGFLVPLSGTRNDRWGLRK